MDEIFKSMSEGKQTSLDRVMLFFFVKNGQNADRLNAKLNLLAMWGLSTEYQETINHFIRTTYFANVKIAGFRSSLLFFVRNPDNDAWMQVTLVMAYIPDAGFEVQLLIPGIIASSTPGLVGEDGFWTAYLPLAAYPA